MSDTMALPASSSSSRAAYCLVYWVARLYPDGTVECVGATSFCRAMGYAAALLEIPAELAEPNRESRHDVCRLCCVRLACIVMRGRRARKEKLMKHRCCAFRTVLASLTCDRCGKTVEVDDPQAVDFLQLDEVGGYESPFGDGSRIEVDLCPSCVKEVLGPWLRITDGPLVEKLNAFDPDRHGGQFPQEEIEPSLPLSRPYEETIVARLRSDPEFAAEYLNQVRRDGDASEIQLAVRRAAIAEMLDPADARFLLRAMASLQEAKRTGGIPAEEVFAKLRATGVAMREAISKKKS